MEQEKEQGKSRKTVKDRKEEKPRKAVKDAAMDFIRFREKSMLEIRRHLKEQGYGPEEIEEALDFLADCDLASDRRYCQAYLRQGLEKGKGPMRLRRELAEKGIEEGLIREEMEELMDGDQERERALEKAEKLLGLPRADFLFSEERPPQVTEKDLARVARRLASLGYRSEVVYDVVGKLRRERVGEADEF